MVLGRIFGSKMETLTEGWRKLHSQELHDQIKKDDTGEGCSNSCYKYTNIQMYIKCWEENLKETGL
jgi:hypothetical protein